MWWGWYLNSRFLPAWAQGWACGFQPVAGVLVNQSNPMKKHVGSHREVNSRVDDYSCLPGFSVPGKETVREPGITGGSQGSPSPIPLLPKSW